MLHRRHKMGPRRGASPSWLGQHLVCRKQPSRSCDPFQRTVGFTRFLSVRGPWCWCPYQPYSTEFTSGQCEDQGANIEFEISPIWKCLENWYQIQFGLTSWRFSSLIIWLQPQEDFNRFMSLQGRRVSPKLKHAGRWNIFHWLGACRPAKIQMLTNERWS